MPKPPCRKQANALHDANCYSVQFVPAVKEFNTHFSSHDGGTKRFDFDGIRFGWKTIMVYDTLLLLCILYTNFQDYVIGNVSNILVLTECGQLDANPSPCSKSVSSQSYIHMLQVPLNPQMPKVLSAYRNS